MSREALERIERQLKTCSNSYEAPNGIIHYRVDGRDLHKLVALARHTPPVSEVTAAIDEYLNYVRGFGIPLLCEGEEWERLAALSQEQQ